MRGSARKARGMSGDGIGIVPEGALWERVIVAMRRAIVLGELAPGAHLKEPLLAQRFGVSRLPIREALAQLEREGLVRVEPRRGAYVLGVTARDISDIYACRLILEARGVQRAAARVDGLGVASLYAHAEQIEVAETVEALAAADMAFHRRLIVLSGSRALLTAWEPLTPLIETILGISNSCAGWLGHPLAQRRHAPHRGSPITAHRGAVSRGCVPGSVPSF